LISLLLCVIEFMFIETDVTAHYVLSIMMIVCRNSAALLYNVSVFRSASLHFIYSVANG